LNIPTTKQKSYYQDKNKIKEQEQVISQSLSLPEFIGEYCWLEYEI
jgi:hypothetical protein